MSALTENTARVSILTPLSYGESVKFKMAAWIQSKGWPDYMLSGGSADIAASVIW